MYNDDLNACLNIIMNNCCNSISGELRSNVSVLCDMIDIRDGVKVCNSLCIDDVLFIIDDICIFLMHILYLVYNLMLSYLILSLFNFFGILTFYKIALF